MANGQTAVEMSRQDIEDAAFDRFMQYFLKRYRPARNEDGPHGDYDFEVDLHRLVRMAVAEAQKPFAHELRLHRSMTLKGMEISTLTNQPNIP